MMLLLLMVSGVPIGLLLSLLGLGYLWELCGLCLRGVLLRHVLLEGIVCLLGYLSLFNTAKSVELARDLRVHVLRSHALGCKRRLR